MKKIIIILLFSFCASIAFSQDTDSYVAPSFNGGKKAFYSYLGKSINYPAIDRENNNNGKITAAIYIGSKGNIKDVKLTGSTDAMLKEVKRVIFASPTWNPAILNGHAIDTTINQVIYFTLDQPRVNNNEDILEIVAYKVPLIVNGNVFTKKMDPPAPKGGTSYDFGLAALKQKDFSTAVSYFNKAEDEGFKNLNLYYNRGVAYLNMNNKDSACKDWAEAGRLGDDEAYKLYQATCPLKTAELKSSAQIDTSHFEGGPFTFVQEMPKFPGGDLMLMQYIQKNIKYPKAAYENGIHGIVYLRFVINTTGKIGKVEVLRGIGAGCEEEAVRVVKSLPDFTPGKQNGHPVPVWINMPVQFKL